MFITTGIDIVDVDRIQGSIDKFGNKFLKRIFTEKEIEYCNEKKVQRLQSYAGRFAAKEAIFKAVSVNVENKFDIEWKDIEILNGIQGRPVVNLHGKLQELIGGKCEIDVSISHIDKVAVASVVAKFGVYR